MEARQPGVVWPSVTSSPRRAHLILNPTADRGRAAGRRAQISSFLSGRGIEAVWHVTQGPGDAEQVARGLPRDELVAAMGGDGTVHEVAAACTHTNRPMAVLPVGSGNCYVKALGIGTGLRKALDVLCASKTRIVDTGEVNGAFFNDGLGIGFDAEVAARVAHAPRLLGGFGGYLWSVLGLLPGFRCREVMLKLDDRPTIRSKTIMVAVALGTTYGGRFRLTPHSLLDDGLFDVLWSEELTVAEVVRLMPSTLWGSHLKNPRIHLARAREVEINFEEATPAHVEGELLSPAHTFHAKVVPKSLRVVAP